MSRLTICVPYRDRARHLKEFVPHLLRKVDCRIVVIEQEEGRPFNRGKLLNVGFEMFGDTELFCTHDVDMLPVKADYYTDPTKIVHLATQVEQFNYKMPYPDYFGGVNVFPSKIFEAIDGFSNDFWGWGAEDDDLLRRCGGYDIVRPEARFKSLKHQHALAKRENQHYHKSNLKKLQSPVLGGLSDCDYRVLSKAQHDGYVMVRVSI